MTMNEEQFRALGGTLPEDSPETRAETAAQAAIEAYQGEPGGPGREADGAGSDDRPYPFIRDLVDVRGRLQTNSNGGPTARRPLSAKTGGVVFHFAGPAQNRSLSALARLQSYASWHCRANGFGAGATGNGLMYHIGIAEDGTKYLCRDIEQDRWHCGAWPYNGTALAVNIPIGEGQSPTPQQLMSATEVALDWLAARGQGRTQVRGHREVGASNCPGDILMRGLVLAVRGGQNPGGGDGGGGGAPVKAEKFYFLYRGERDRKVARAAADALVEAGLARDRVGAFGVPAPEGRDGPEDIRWASEAALDEPLGMYPTTFVGTPVLRHVPDRVERNFKDGGKWYGKGVSDLWDGLGSSYQDTINKVAACVRAVADREKLPEERAVEIYRGALDDPESREVPRIEAPPGFRIEEKHIVTKDGKEVGAYSPLA